jgi:AcrR family transcriptional regulator
MRNTKDDRRSRRTRQMLNAALLALMLEDRYDEITVQDIIDRADVGRATFYAHYLDKDDLLISEFTRVLDTLIQQIDQRSPADQPDLPSLTLFFGHVQEHYPLYKGLARGGGIDLLYKKGHQRLRQLVEQRLQAAMVEPAAPARLPFVADYIAGTILNILKWWLEHEMPYTPEQVDALFRQLVQPGVLATLRLASQ